MNYESCTPKVKKAIDEIAKTSGHSRQEVIDAYLNAARGKPVNLALIFLD